MAELFRQLDVEAARQDVEDGRVLEDRNHLAGVLAGLLLLLLVLLLLLFLLSILFVAEDGVDCVDCLLSFALCQLLSGGVDCVVFQVLVVLRVE